ncbi:MAG: response regulator transcription factor [Planctomycetota bacterium]
MDGPREVRRAVRPRSLRVVVVDAHGMFVDLLGAALAAFYELEIVAKASTVSMGGEACARHAPDLLILNPLLPDGCGLSILRMLAAVNPAARVILVASGVTLAKVQCTDALSRQVHAIVDQTAGLPAFSNAIVQLLESIGRAPLGLRAVKILSGRQFEVFELLGDGLTNAEIAGRLGIGVQTVETHRKCIAKKLGATGVELVRLAVLHVVANGARPQETQLARRK